MKLKTTTYVIIGLLVATLLAELAFFAYIKHYAKTHFDKEVPVVSATSYSDDYESDSDEEVIIPETVNTDASSMPAQPKVEITHPDNQEMNIVVNCAPENSSNSTVRHIKADTLIIVGKGMDVLVAE